MAIVRERIDRIAVTIAFGLAGAGVSSAAHAEHSLVVGVAGTYENDALVDEDGGFGVAPIFEYEYEGLFGGTLEASLDRLSYERILPKGFLGTALVTTRDAPVDDLDGFDRDTAVEIGGALANFQPFGIFSLSVLGDVAGAHSGIEIGAGYTMLHESDDWAFEFTLDATYRSSDLGTFLYGVEDDDEDDSDFDAFRVDGHVVPGVELSVDYALSDDLTLSSSARAEYLPDAVTDSPAIDKAYEALLELEAKYELTDALSVLAGAGIESVPFDDTVIDEDYELSSFVGVAYEF